MCTTDYARRSARMDCRPCRSHRRTPSTTTPRLRTTRPLERTSCACRPSRSTQGTGCYIFFWERLRQDSFHPQSKKANLRWLLGSLAHPGRFELPTPGFVVRCSIQLSYGCLGDAVDSTPLRNARGKRARTWCVWRAPWRRALELRAGRSGACPSGGAAGVPGHWNWL